MFLFVIYKFLVKIVDYFEYLAISPDRNGKPGAKKLPFFVLKKRPTEALFKAIEMELFCEDLKCRAGMASNYFFKTIKRIKILALTFFNF
jgi:hypothetical protein